MWIRSGVALTQKQAEESDCGMMTVLLQRAITIITGETCVAVLDFYFLK